MPVFFILTLSVFQIIMAALSVSYIKRSVFLIKSKLPVQLFAYEPISRAAKNIKLCFISVSLEFFAHSKIHFAISCKETIAQSVSQRTFRTKEDVFESFSFSFSSGSFDAALGFSFASSRL